jgi:hypothetical protein
MPDREHHSKTAPTEVGINPGYAAYQIAKALTTCEEHEDAETRDRAKAKVSRWKSVFANILSGSVDYGSRTPVAKTPTWATLEVLTGGFATGQLLANGPLQEHEKTLLGLLGDISRVAEGRERRSLNAYFLSEEGLAVLREQLRTGCYEVSVPEEGALLVMAWLAEHGYSEKARGLLDEISPYFAQLRFYPVPLERPRRSGTRVHLQEVAKTVSDLRKIKPNRRVLAQKEAVEIWATFYDRIVAIFLETIDEEWPCRKYHRDWSQRALALLGEYAVLRQDHKICGKSERPGGHFSQLREFLARCATKPQSLTGREVGRIKLILNRYIQKRGLPGSAACVDTRRRQQGDVDGPTYHQVATVVAHRLEGHPQSEGLDEMSDLMQAISKVESAGYGIPEGTPVPACIQHKVERCLNETVAALVERGLITSGEALARVLPQMTAGVRAAGITEPTLRQLYTAIYRAFRRRRSLLLLNLEKQVQIEELPWIAVIEQFRGEGLSDRELAKQTLEEVTVLAITSFPYAILPNKLLQELCALVKGAGLDIPLVDEVAADIFMGRFSGKFLAAAKRAANLVDGTLYARYFGIDYGRVRRIPDSPEKPERRSFWPSTPVIPDPFADFCASRAGVSIGTWDAATNGMIIEQQQILTTQNLAVLCMGLDLVDDLNSQFGTMAKECFRWICQRQQMKIDKWHARLIMLKNTAYAWRQMVFFLALLPGSELTGFCHWAQSLFDEQEEHFRTRFSPALRGLFLTVEGQDLESEAAHRLGVRRFLGWSKEGHWLLTEMIG